MYDALPAPGYEAISLLFTDSCGFILLIISFPDSPDCSPPGLVKGQQSHWLQPSQKCFSGYIVVRALDTCTSQDFFPLGSKECACTFNSVVFEVLPLQVAQGELQLQQILLQFLQTHSVSVLIADEWNSECSFPHSVQNFIFNFRMTKPRFTSTL